MCACRYGVAPMTLARISPVWIKQQLTTYGTRCNHQRPRLIIITLSIGHPNFAVESPQKTPAKVRKQPNKRFSKLLATEISGYRPHLWSHEAFVSTSCHTQSACVVQAGIPYCTHAAAGGTCRSQLSSGMAG